MGEAEGTVLSERELAVLDRRERGQSSAEIAAALGEDEAAIEGIEREAERAIERARNTIEVVGELRRSPASFTVEAGSDLDTLPGEIYEQGDEAAIDVGYCHSDLRARLGEVLRADLVDEATGNPRLARPVEITLTREGEVRARTPADRPDGADASHERGTLEAE